MPTCGCNVSFRIWLCEGIRPSHFSRQMKSSRWNVSICTWNRLLMKAYRTISFGRRMLLNEWSIVHLHFSSEIKALQEIEDHENVRLICQYRQMPDFSLDHSCLDCQTTPCLCTWNGVHICHRVHVEWSIWSNSQCQSTPDKLTNQELYENVIEWRVLLSWKSNHASSKDFGIPRERQVMTHPSLRSRSIGSETR